jgi:hypothetical protein
MRDADVARAVGELADAEGWPTEKRVEQILWSRQVAAHLHPAQGLHLLAVPDLVGRARTRAKPEERLWEKVRPLDPCPRTTAAGSRTCRRPSAWPACSDCRSSSSGRASSAALDEILGDVPGVTLPAVPADRTHVYYQYCAYVPDSASW